MIFNFTIVTAQNNMQTCWFFEWARGQYKTLRSREGRTKSLQNAFYRKYPKNQMFTKVELAKFLNAYQEIWEGKRLVIGPHIVVRGNEKNYAQFIANNLPDNTKKINNVYFEDAIAKCILIKNADKRYGKKPDSIGEMKQVVVPYALSLISIITENKLDLYKIWKNQQVSQQLSYFIYDLMKQVNQFILDTYAGQHYIEKAKREECWELVKNHLWNFNISEIKSDLTACNKYFILLLELVCDCFKNFGNIIDPVQNFVYCVTEAGKSLEDIEEELGFPRGWTKIGGEAVI